uniref:3-hydroxyisobutyryl-CoA hydrolase n=1 Tax=Zooxanthella nutricula TaxID=1333877 RepID=A0A7S2II77_9DINO
MAEGGAELGLRPQGCFIKLYCDDQEEPYELHSISYKLHPTGVAVCTFNTPKNMNCLTNNQQWETFALLEHMARDDDVRVAVWTGAGKAFNAGADLKGDQTLMVPEHVREKMRARGMGPVPGDFVLKPQTLAFWDFPKPSVVAVNGMAIGGAANMALANFHDFVLCSTEARFMFPFPKLGFTPELGSSFVMPYLVGMARAKELFFLSDWLPADRAKEMGLVNRVVAPEALMSEAMAVAEQLSSKHPAALHHAKRIVNHHLRKRLEEVLDEELGTIRESLKATKGPPGVAQWMKEREEVMRQARAKL